MLLMSVLFVFAFNTSSLVYYDPGVDMSPYLHALSEYDGVLPARIDIVNRGYYGLGSFNRRGYFYAGGGGRIIIYDKSYGMATYEEKRWVLLHELGHQDCWNTKRILSEDCASAYADNRTADARI